MYTPAHFAFPDRDAQLAFMQRYAFAALVTVAPDGAPEATHLPFLVEDRGDGAVVLVSHMARANRQWERLADQTALVIFAEPHAYVSPFWYEKPLSVPTWNYVAIHAYGRARLLETPEAATAVLEKSIRTFDAAWLERWQQLDAGYKAAMLKGLVAFEIAVERVDAKQKLSQNRSEREQETIIAHLGVSTIENERVIAEYMLKSGPGA
jgi:transcriptional regulator